MAFLRPNRAEYGPLIPPNTAAAEKVMATIDRVQLDPKQVMLVGSAALVLYGSRLHNDTIIENSRPSDVDFLATTNYMESLNATGKHAGLLVTHKPGYTNSVLRLDSEPLPVDLISNYRGDMPPSEFDQDRYALFAHVGRPLAGTAIRIASPEHIKRELRARRVDKSRRDLKDFKAASRRHGSVR